MECNDNHSTYFYEKYKECIHRGKGIYAHVGIIQINNENSDYLCLGDTAVLMQLLWDIITEDIFE